MCAQRVGRKELRDIGVQGFRGLEIVVVDQWASLLPFYIMLDLNAL